MYAQSHSFIPQPVLTCTDIMSPYFQAPASCGELQSLINEQEKVYRNMPYSKDRKLFKEKLDELKEDFNERMGERYY